VALWLLILVKLLCHFDWSLEDRPVMQAFKGHVCPLLVMRTTDNQGRAEVGGGGTVVEVLQPKNVKM